MSGLPAIIMGTEGFDSFPCNTVAMIGFSAITTLILLRSLKICVVVVDKPVRMVNKKMKRNRRRGQQKPPPNGSSRDMRQAINTPKGGE